MDFFKLLFQGSIQWAEKNFATEETSQWKKNSSETFCVWTENYPKYLWIFMNSRALHEYLMYMFNLGCVPIR